MVITPGRRIRLIFNGALAVALVLAQLLAAPATAPAYATGGGALFGVSVGLSSPAAGAGHVTYTVAFTTSPTGALKSGASTVTVDAPGVRLPECGHLYAANRDIGGACPGAGSRQVLYVYEDVDAGQQVEIVYGSVTNPPTAGSYSLTVSTSSDTAASARYSIVGGGSVSGVSVDLSTAAAGVKGVTYTVSFRTSATGGLGDAGMITVDAPGLILPTCAYLVDEASTSGGMDACSSTGPGSRLLLSDFGEVGAGRQMQLVFDGVTNPAAAGSYSLTVSTSSDTAASARYSIVGGGSVSGVSVGLSTPAAGVKGVTYTVLFTTSATGTLHDGGGSITVNAPGTTLPTCAELVDVASGDSGQSCSSGRPGSTQVLVAGFDVGAGRQMRLTFDGVTNPAVAGSHSLSVSTSSDTAASARYRTVPAAPISGDIVNSSGRAIAGAAIQACFADRTTCFTGTSDRQGRFSLDVEVGYGYQVTAHVAAGDYSVGAALPFPLPVIDEHGISDVRLRADVFPVPEGMTVAERSRGIPSVHMGDATPVTVRGCSGGIAAAVLTSTDDPSLQSVPTILNETHPGSGVYEGSIPPQSFMHGAAQIKSNVYCFSAVFPKAGPSAGGTRVAINGTHLSTVTSVRFGTTAAESFQILSDSLIVAVSPPGQGVVDVTVANTSGRSSTTAAGQYTYYSLDSVSPATVSSSGGTRVTIRGDGLHAVDLVLFGDRPAQQLEVRSDHEITAIAPSGAGEVKVFGAAIGGSPADLEAAANIAVSYGGNTTSFPAASPAARSFPTAMPGSGHPPSRPLDHAEERGIRAKASSDAPELETFYKTSKGFLEIAGALALGYKIRNWALAVDLAAPFLESLAAYGGLAIAYVVIPLVVAGIALYVASLWIDPSGTIMD
ncbi:IPT/TIG domain-containing protein, partial [Actinoplanes cyaneus]